MKPSSPLRTSLLILLAVASSVAASSPLRAEEPAEAAKPSPVTVAAVRVEPVAPAADTLCRLTIDVHNAGERTASFFAFRVTVNGQELPVYRQELFAFPAAAGETVPLSLFNFWTTESSRPAPADGKLRLVVELVEARWVEIEKTAEGEVWRPIGEVAGLPSAATLTVDLKP